ncbi:hypothetical protein ACE1OA_02830 [Streptomyces sp. JL2001]|uniref:hypothetical protein n=1 Tax=Streptomyces sp. JL2001 TaxID=3342488 RepID=UPI003D806B02
MPIPDVTLKGISLYGTVRAGTAVPVAISFRDTDGRPVEPATAKLEVSFDGGATWSVPATAALRHGTLGATLSLGRRRAEPVAAPQR